MWVSSTHKARSIRFTFKNYWNTCNLNFSSLWWLLLLNFSVLTWEWFLHSSVLERTEFDLSKINWLRGVILFIPIVLVPWDRFSLCHTPIRPISAFRDQISILIVGCVITRFASVLHLEIILQLIKDPYGTRKFPKQAPTSL